MGSIPAGAGTLLSLGILAWHWVTEPVSALSPAHVAKFWPRAWAAWLSSALKQWKSDVHFFKVKPCQRELATDEIQEKKNHREHSNIIARAWYTSTEQWLYLLYLLYSLWKGLAIAFPWMVENTEKTVAHTRRFSNSTPDWDPIQNMLICSYALYYSETSKWSHYWAKRWALLW